MQDNTQVTGKEVFFDKNRLIVSKTDLKGIITYANDVFIDIAEYSEDELLGQPHSIIRHPDMPRCVFKLLWDTLSQKEEIFAYVVNKTKYGNHYWVFAHVTPSLDENGNIIAYHSSRRVPNRDVVENAIIPTYKMLLDIENKYSNRKEGMMAAFDALVKILNEKNMTYDQFIFSLVA